MYKFKRETQISFTDFNQPLGLKMNPDNRWIKKAAMIPWDTNEAEYAKLFPSHTGMPVKPLRMALGSLLIQKQYHFPNEELVEQIREKGSEKRSKSSFSTFAATLDISKSLLKITPLCFRNPMRICSIFWKRFICSSSICLTTKSIQSKIGSSASANRISAQSSEVK